MGFLDKFFRRHPGPPPPPMKVERVSFRDLTQGQLNDLALMMPMTIDHLRSAPEAIVNLHGLSRMFEPEPGLIRGLTEIQYRELREIQEVFWTAHDARDSKKSLSLYLRCVERAPWHCQALYGAGLSFWAQGDEKRAFAYLKQAIDLAPQDESIRTSFARVAGMVSQAAPRGDEQGGVALTSASPTPPPAPSISGTTGTCAPPLAGHQNVSTEECGHLVQELISIGSVPKILRGQGSEPFFWHPPGEGIGPTGQWDPRTREIGELLYRRSGNRLKLMRDAHERIVATLGPLAGHALSAHWDEIGTAEQDAGGECWMH